MTVDLILRIIAGVILLLICLYWYFAKKKTFVIKPKTSTYASALEKYAISTGVVFIGMNLMGLTVFSFESIITQIIGFLFVIAGCTEAFLGRFTLGNNWTECYEYQIKKKHELIQSGIYSWVRHPIYGGFSIAVAGAFVVSQTYLCIPLSILMFVIMRYLAKREEQLLTKHFGREYIHYMKKTKMLIPFIF